MLKILKESDSRIITDVDIPESEVKWLFYPYLPRGEVTILNADPGSGKTYIASWICAMVSAGEGFPIESNRNERGSGLCAYLSKEDKYDTTIIPRYRACGGKHGKLLFTTLENMPETFNDALIDELIESGVDLIVFDAVSSFIGNANMNQSNEVRKALMPLYEKIAGTQTAVLLIAHNNKMSGVTNPQYRITGSVDFAAFVRSGLTVSKDDSGEFVLAQYKNNFGENGPSLSFRLKQNTTRVPGLEFTGKSPLSAEELTGKVKSVKKHSLVEEVASVLYNELTKTGGWGRTCEVNAALMREGYKKSTIERARKELGVRSETVYDDKNKKRVGLLFLPGVSLPQESFFQAV